MIEKLKQHRWISLSASVAAGFVLAHIIDRLFDDFWLDHIETFASDNGWALTWFVMAAVLVYVAIRYKSAVSGWLRKHKTGFTFLTIGILFSAAKGGKTYTQVAAAGLSDDAARLAANRAAALWLLIYGLFVLLYFLAMKLIRLITRRRI